MPKRRSTSKRKPTAKRAKPETTIARIERELAEIRRRQDLLYRALGLPESAKAGERGTIGELREAALRVQEYLLRTSERIDNILGTLKNHRELLVKMNNRIYMVGTRERIEMELAIKKNTLSILALNGIEIEQKLVDEIEDVLKSARNQEIDIQALRKSKEKVDRMFDGEVKRFDLSGIYKTKNRQLPGYG